MKSKPPRYAAKHFHDPILPGATIGILGSGQLGRMLAIAARRFGYRIHVYSPDRETPAGQIADRETTGSWDDLDAISRFARSVDVVTLEFETFLIARRRQRKNTPHAPGPLALHTTQHRLREKHFWRQMIFQ